MSNSDLTIIDHSRERENTDIDSEQEGLDLLLDFVGDLELELVENGETIAVNWRDNEKPFVGEFFEDPFDNDANRDSQEDSTENESSNPRPTEPVAEETESEPTQSDTGVIEATPAKDDLPDETPSVEQDPVDWLPEHFIDTIQGVPTVNRKGYAVIASQYGVEVKAEPITLAEGTDFEYATFNAIATTEDGKEYSGIGSAHVKRGDDSNVLNELAETRAMKRAVAWATGIGMTAIEEMQSGDTDA